MVKEGADPTLREWQAMARSGGADKAAAAGDDLGGSGKPAAAAAAVSGGGATFVYPYGATLNVQVCAHAMA
jgi:hypothetical protein